jgi:hypothetical protein
MKDGVGAGMRRRKICPALAEGVGLQAGADITNESKLELL